MADGYTQRPRLLKGAIVQFSSPLVVPIPNIIVFQYNPESLSRSLTPWTPPEREQPEGEQQPPARAQPYDPEESFTVSLVLDATDALEEPGSHPVAVATGVADRVAALEMLLYPTDEASVLGQLAGAAVSALGGGGGVAQVPARREVPVVLFWWGPGRIVPVRITSFAVEEQHFSPTLYPVRAKVQVGMRVLTPAAFGNQPETAAVKLAKAAYTLTRAQKEALALANVANTAESVAGMLPI